MDSIEHLRKYLDKTRELFGVDGADIHLWLETQGKHKEMSFSEALKLKRKVEEHFSDIYGVSLAWSIALTHFLIDFDISTKQVVVFERQGDILVPSIKTVRELQEEVQKAMRDKKGENQ